MEQYPNHRCSNPFNIKMSQHATKPTQWYRDQWMCSECRERCNRPVIKCNPKHIASTKLSDTPPQYFSTETISEPSPSHDTILNSPDCYTIKRIYKYALKRSLEQSMFVCIKSQIYATKENNSTVYITDNIRQVNIIKDKSKRRKQKYPKKIPRNI
jgi:hypothetical protein